MFIIKENKTGINFFNSLLFAVFIFLLGLPLLGLILGIEKNFEQTEMRKLAGFPKTNLATLYRDNWRQDIDKFFNDNFGFRGQMIKASNLVQYSVFRAVPMANTQGLVLGEDTESVTNSEAIDPQVLSANAAGTDQADETGELNTDSAYDLPNQHADQINANKPPAATKVPVNLPWVENKVVIGKDGWLFFDKEKTIDDYRCLTPFTGAELARIKSNLLAKRDELAKQGISFVVFIPPNKHSIYPEFLPDSIKKVGSVCRYDQVVNVAKSAGIILVDPRQAMLNEKKVQQVYYKTDTHWDDVGAFISYQILLDRIRSQYPDLQGRTWADYQVNIVTAQGRDLARMLSLQSVLKEQVPKLLPVKPLQAKDATVSFADVTESPSKKARAKEVAGIRAPKILVFRDSFMSTIIPFMSEDFSRSVYVWSYGIEPDIVSAEKPDVVVLELVERYLASVLLNQLGPKI